MRLIIKRPVQQQGEASPLEFLSQSRMYRLKSRSFVLSVLFHGAVVAALLLQKNLPGAQAATGQPIYETLIKPQEKKLIWYHFKKDLPNIDSSTTHVKEGPNTGKIRSPRLIIAQSKHGSKKEFVWQDTPVELPDRVKAPNLISLHPPKVVEAKTLPPPAAPAAPPHKEFVAPPPTAPKPEPTQIAALPLPSAPYAGANPQIAVSAPSLLEGPQMKVYKPFVAPPGQNGGTGTGRTNGAGTDPNAPLDAPPVGTPGKLNMAAINLDSVIGGATLPPGRRPGDFSAGPNVGEPSAERSGRGTAMVPGLTTRGGNTTGDSSPDPALDPSIPRHEVNYREVMTHAMGSSFSVPLWPGARRIPPSLDLLFGNRPVYTMILPAPRMPQYAGDWVLWFSELKPSETTVQIHSPLPEKKIVLDAGPATTAWAGGEIDVRINLIIDATGHVQSLKIAKVPAELSAQVAIDDVRSWLFKPATRNGVPIPVEAVLDIPFRKPK